MEHELKSSFVGGRKRNSHSPSLDYLLPFKWHKLSKGISSKDAMLFRGHLDAIEK